MKKFSLAEYLANPERKVVTRDGNSVRIVCTNKLDNNYPVVALVHDGDCEKCYSYTKFGKLYTYQNRDCELDLFFAPTKHEGWINLPALLPEEQGDLPHPFKIPVFETEAKARMARENIERCRIKIEDNALYYSVKIEWEE